MNVLHSDFTVYAKDFYYLISINGFPAHVVEPLCDVPRSVRSWARNVSQFRTSRSEFQLQGIIKVLKLFSGTFPAEFNFEMWRGHDPGIKHTYARESLLLLRDSKLAVFGLLTSEDI